MLKMHPFVGEPCPVGHSPRSLCCHDCHDDLLLEKIAIRDRFYAESGIRGQHTLD